MGYGGSGLLQKAIWTAVIVIVVLWIVRDPQGAGHAGHAIGTFAGQAASAFGTLISSL
jgi:hypothetical protein